MATLAVLTNRCEPPWGYKPEHDSIIDPPDAPKFIEPHADTTLWWTYPSRPTVTFSWSSAQGAERYDLDIDTSSVFSTLVNDPYRIITYARSPSVTVTAFEPEQRSRKYYCRVKAISAKWRNGGTEWSAIRSFTLRFQPGKSEDTVRLKGQCGARDRMTNGRSKTTTS